MKKYIVKFIILILNYTIVNKGGEKRGEREREKDH